MVSKALGKVSSNYTCMGDRMKICRLRHVSLSLLVNPSACNKSGVSLMGDARW